MSIGICGLFLLCYFVMNEYPWKEIAGSVHVDIREMKRKEFFDFRGFAMFGTRDLSSAFWIILEKCDEMIHSFSRAIDEQINETCSPD